MLQTKIYTTINVTDKIYTTINVTDKIYTTINVTDKNIYNNKCYR